MRRRQLISVRTLFVLGIAPLLITWSGSAPASATAVPVTCANFVVKSSTATISKCTYPKNTGGTATVVATTISASPTSSKGTWKITWATKHGTTNLSYTIVSSFGSTTCPHAVTARFTGQVTKGGTGAAAKVIPLGQKVSATFCAPLTGGGFTLAHGTKLTL